MDNHRASVLSRSAIFAALAAVHLTGCVGTNLLCDHASGGLQYAHASHVSAGPPFGPRSDEDALDVAGLYGRCQSGRVFTEALIGVSLTDSGFYGPDDVFIGRIGVELWSAR